MRAVGVSRRAVDRFKQRILELGFNHLETLSPEEWDDHDFDQSARCPAVLSLVLRLLGRQDGPWSEYDRPLVALELRRLREIGLLLVAVRTVLTATWAPWQAWSWRVCKRIPCRDAA
jgi:hypothetical protein